MNSSVTNEIFILLSLSIGLVATSPRAVDTLLIAAGTFVAMKLFTSAMLYSLSRKNKDRS